MLIPEVAYIWWSAAEKWNRRNGADVELRNQSVIPISLQTRGSISILTQAVALDKCNHVLRQNYSCRRSEIRREKARISVQILVKHIFCCSLCFLNWNFCSCLFQILYNQDHLDIFWTFTCNTSGKLSKILSIKHQVQSLLQTYLRYSV